MTPAPTVTLQFSQAIVQAAERLGMRLPAELLAQLKTHPARVPLSLQDALWQAIGAAQADPLIGVKMGLEIQAGHLDSAGLLLMSCDTLGDALEALLEYFPIITEGSLLEAVPEQGGVRLYYYPGYDICQELRAEAAIACFVHLSRWMTGGRSMPAEAGFRHAASVSVTRYQALLGSPVRFDTEDYSLLYSQQDLGAPLIQANAAMRGHLQQLADRMLASLTETGLGSQVAVLLRHRPRWGKERIAELLGMSGRHLTRRLAEESLSFKQLRDVTLYRMAAERLQQDERLRDIADALGFSDESAFAKAFRRWAGVSPAQYREQARMNRAD
jgi:AraC-like DNA-binding protein